MKDLKITEAELEVYQDPTFLKLAKSKLNSYSTTDVILHYKYTKRLVFKRSDLEQWLIESKKKTVAEIQAEVRLPKGKRGGRL